MVITVPTSAEVPAEVVGSLGARWAAWFGAVVFAGLMLLVAATDAVAQADGKPGPAGDWFTVGDAQYRFDVTGSWTRVPKGTYGDDTLMEFVGETKDTWAIVYVVRGSWSLDEMVDFRRGEIRVAVDSLESEETRTLLPDDMIPVSHARYAGVLTGGWRTYTWWASTIVTNAGGVEVLASTASGPSVEGQIERLVKSLQVRLSGAY